MMLETWKLLLNVFVLLAIKIPLHCSDAQATNEFEPCQTPSNKSGICLKISDCKPMLDMIMGEFNQETKKYLLESQCGRINGADASRRVLVCCPFDEIELEKVPGNYLPKPELCGKHVIATRMFGGMEADASEFPWMALILYKTRSGELTTHCGGSLINHRYVLTVAHCVKNGLIPSSMTVHAVRLGEHNLATMPDCTESNGVTRCNPMHIDVGVTEIIPHENYEPRSKSSFFDIALIRMERIVKFTDNISPICLPINREMQKKDFANYTMEFAGWGVTERNNSNVLLKGRIKVVELTKCAEKYKLYGISIDGSQLCAGGDGLVDTCCSDSGGPLMVTLDRFYYIAGVASFGANPCNLRGWPGIYTRVGHFMPWIREQLKP